MWLSWRPSPAPTGDSRHHPAVHRPGAGNLPGQSRIDPFPGVEAARGGDYGSALWRGAEIGAHRL